MSPANPAFSFVLAPLPRRGRISPRPALAERSSPAGKGETLGYFMQGAPPLASPRLHPGGTYSPSKNRYPAGGVPFFSPANDAFSFLSCPLSPRPPSPTGKGEIFTLFRRGLRPRHPCIRPFAALIVPAMRTPHARSLRFAAKTIGSGSLLAVPAAKERGDRGRWNYPSQATAAFEMVLSPEAGRASAARVQLSPLPRRVPQRQGEQVPQAA